MVTKKNIIVEEVDEKTGEKKIVYHGEDKRFYNRDYRKEFWGIPLSDWIKMIVFVVGTLLTANTYVQKNEARLSSVEKITQSLTDELTKTSQALQDYMQASDIFQSAAWGQQFKAGHPIDGSFKKKFEWHHGKGDD